MPVSRGIGYGKVVMIGGMIPPDLTAVKVDDPELEQERAKQGMEGVRTRIRQKLAGHISSTERAILEAHLAILGDASLTNRILEKISQGRPASQAILETAEFFSGLLQNSESQYIRERADDLHEISHDILHEIYGAKFQRTVELTEPSVVVVEKLTPQQLLDLDRTGIRALVMESGGATSHAVILARSLAIPTLIGVKNLPQFLSPGQEIIVDANRGVVIPKLTPVARRYYERELTTQQKRQAALVRDAMASAITVDGRAIEVAANLSSAEELEPAFSNGADGIGLFRTEMLFAGREQPPSEDEQFEIYAQAARAARGRPVVLRIFDIGADKPVPYLKLPAEDNPFLGFRGVRLYEQHQELVRGQIRAILRASAVGRVHMMIPMVATREEIVWVKAQLAQAQNELTERQMPFDPAMPVGIMIEVPSVAFILDQLCEEVEFFSIGTNDLVQYFFAADRGNPRVAHLSNVRHPSFLRFLKQIVDEVHKREKHIGMCGEMAGDISHLPLLLGLGLDGISAASSEIPILKTRISRLCMSDCQSLLSSALQCKNAAEVDSLLAAGTLNSPESSLLDRDLVILNSKSESKEEAIREIINSFYVEARTNDPDQLEEAVWTREEVYSTGLGHGFAIPHCKSDAVITESIGVLKLSQPVEWGALDGQPVHTVILLAARESNANGRHMQVFSQLARKLVSEKFRLQLDQAEDVNAVLECLGNELLISS
jgi:fructose-specific PTS system IIA-like component